MILNIVTMELLNKFKNYLLNDFKFKIIQIIPPTNTKFDFTIKKYKFEPNNLIYYTTKKIPKELTLLSKFFVDNNLNKITDFTFANIEVFINLKKTNCNRLKFYLKMDIYFFIVKSA